MADWTIRPLGNNGYASVNQSGERALNVFLEPMHLPAWFGKWPIGPEALGHGESLLGQPSRVRSRGRRRGPFPLSGPLPSWSHGRRDRAARGEPLTTGWEPDLPPDDTLLRRAVLVHASWPVEVARSTGRPHRSGPDWAGGRIGDRGALTNPVVLKQPLTEPAATIAEIGELFPAEVPYLLINPWPFPDLAGHGLVLIGHPPLMVRLPAAGPDQPQRAVEVREVRTAEELAVAERVLVEGYPMPEVQPLAPGNLLGPGILAAATRVWLGRVDGEPVAVAAAHRHAGATLVEYVATLPHARGRGAGAAVTWAATQAHPDEPAVLIANDDGRPVYERMGYLAVERWAAWLRPGS